MNRYPGRAVFAGGREAGSGFVGAAVPSGAVAKRDGAGEADGAGALPARDAAVAIGFLAGDSAGQDVVAQVSPRAISGAARSSSEASR